MAEPTSLESLQALYADLLALSEGRLSNLQRLMVQIEAHMQDFKTLLEKKPRSEQSRKSLATGKLEVSGDEWAINAEFQQDALKLADDLDLDEIEAARIFLEAQGEAEASGRPAATNSIVRFHQRRVLLLDSLRIILQQAADIDQEEQLRSDLGSIAEKIAQSSRDASSNYTQKCLSSMGEIKVWLQRLADKSNSASVLGQAQQIEEIEAMEYQRTSLVKQHESLSIIVLCLVKEGRCVLQNFQSILDSLKRVDRYDNLLLHYFPAISAFISRFGGIEGGKSLADARSLNGKIFPQSDETTWTLPYVHAAFRALWLAEYGGWYGENHDGSIPDNQLEDEARQRAKQFADCLKDGAFDFILSLSADVKSADWHDPARHGLRIWMQRKAPALLGDSVPFADFFQEALMEQLEAFIEGFITNLPDVLRKLRVEEDEQRQLSKDHEHDLNLEKFILTISYVFEGRHKAALDGFWDVQDGALLGFVHWASRRASTPLVSAFCEMLQAISGDDECATAAHKFLLDDYSQSSGKMRKTHSLTWNQIFKELTFFCQKIRDRPSLPQPQAYRGGKPHSDLIEAEPESSMMLECYLRLITRLCSKSEAVRDFLFHHPSFNLTELLFQLVSSSIGARLRACAFTTLQSLLSNKTREFGEHIWSALDFWVNGHYSPGSTMPKSSFASSSVASVTAILRGLSSGFEEPSAFVQLLQALVSPYSDDSGLRDGLPFPENLGISTRQPGIDPFIDCVVGDIFADRIAELNDPVQIRLLQLNCVNFIATCLDTFNENLVIFASQSNISVDSAIQASNLQTYVLLHPFVRVMEWMLNEKVMRALFATVHQDPSEVGRSAPDSPLVLCLLQGLHVISSILDLQATYLDIIRPLVKSQPNYRGLPNSNAAFGSFEDGVLSHLSIISDLGLYCGTGHSELIITSLQLLEKLSSCPKLASNPNSRKGGRSDRSKVLAALDEDAQTVSTILLWEMQSEVDVNQGPESSAYIIKDHILDFLIACLRAAPGHQTIAHLLLGFQCGAEGLSIDPDSPFSRDTSLFHTILDLVLNSNLTDDTGIPSWLVSLNYKGLQILKDLWSSPVSTEFIMAEMRSHGAFFQMFVKEIVLVPEILWDGIDVSDPSFSSSKGAACMSQFLCRRTLILQYLSAELRQVARSHAPSLKQRLFETLLGSTTADGGEQMAHATIFDWFDFMDPEFPRINVVPQISWFGDRDLYACLDNYEDPLSTLNVVKLEQLLVLRKSELELSGLLTNPHDVDIVNGQAQDLINFFVQDNQIKDLGASRLTVLRSWVQLTLVMIESGKFDSASKTSFVLKSLQTIMPRLENDLEVIPEAIELARLAKTLVFSLDFSSASFKQGDMGNVVSDRLFHLFRVSLRAINTLGAQVVLKEYFYNICYRYLSGMSDITSMSGMRRRHSIQTIKSAGERFLDLVCDDAHSGEPTCRIAALLVLGALVKMGKLEDSQYIVESLSRLNFIGILVDSIQNIPSDLQETPVDDVDLQLSYCHARLALLLQISQTRLGASAVLNAGLLPAIIASGLFATDPDLGVDIEGPGAVAKHYGLLAALMRIICACILSRGSQNQHSLEQGRRFLSENRLSILAVLKKSAGLGGTAGPSEQSVEELSDSFMLLISVTGFLDFEEQTVQRKQTKGFTVFT